VIVDHLSEMSEATRNEIRPHLRDFPVNALVVTSRIREHLGDAVDDVIETLRIEGKQLSFFIFDYLKQLGQRNLFEDQELFTACSQLTTLVGERSTITVLLAKLYAEQMINSKEDPTVGSRPPDNIPDLMIAYLEELNSKASRVTGNEYPTLKEDAKVIAWECLKQIYRPAPVECEAIVTALNREDGDKAKAYLEYFEKYLRLIRTIGPAKDQIRFALDPLAEYFAGLYLVECYGEDEQKWHNFLAEADAKPGTPEAIKGFLLAVRDCYLAKVSEAKMTDFVPEELGRRVGLGSNRQPGLNCDHQT
jgi:hypothetical protein